MDGLHDAFARLLDQVAGAEPEAALRELEASGFLSALADGISLAEAAPLLIELGRRAAPIAWAETMLARGGAAPALAAPFARAAAMAGAGEKALELSVAHARERSQFGKPLAAQQAVQQLLAVMAEDVLALRLAVELAAARGLPLDPPRVALAKAAASAAAPRIADGAHAIHGAIGISAEHALPRYTAALRRWRLEAGSESHWHAALGETVLASGADPIDWARAALF